jgi:hypothetical protein
MFVFALTRWSGPRRDAPPRVRCLTSAAGGLADRRPGPARAAQARARDAEVARFRAERSVRRTCATSPVLHGTATEEPFMRFR